MSNFKLDKNTILQEASLSDLPSITVDTIDTVSKTIEDTLRGLEGFTSSSFDSSKTIKYVADMVPVIKVNECDENVCDDLDDDLDEILGLSDDESNDEDLDSGLYVDTINYDQEDIDYDDEDLIDDQEDIDYDDEDLQECGKPYIVERHMIKKLAESQRVSFLEALNMISENNNLNVKDIYVTRKTFKYSPDMLPIFKEEFNLSNKYFIEFSSFKKVADYYTEKFGYEDLENTVRLVCEYFKIIPKDVIIVMESRNKTKKRLSNLKNKAKKAAKPKMRQKIQERVMMIESDINIMTKSGILNTVIKL